MKTFKAGLFLICLCLAALPQTASACRIIPVPPPPEPVPPVEPPQRRTAPILTKSHQAEVRIVNNVARVNVTAVFHNPNGVEMEGTYFFPIEPDAVVREFSMLIDGKEQKAEVLEADKARQIYESIVRQMKDPGLLEYVGSRMLKARVYPIPARGDVEVRLEYHQVVPSDGGLYHFRYPLLSARPNAETIGELALRVTIADGPSVKLFYSPSHSVDTLRKGDRTVSGGFEQSKVVPDREFDLVWSYDEADIGLSALAYRPADEDGFVMISLTPRVDLAAGRVEPKDIVFAFDKSGSMAGDKIKQARAALSYCLNRLNEGDRFAVVAFSTDVDTLTDGLVAASPETVAASVAKVADMQARGGTAIYDALVEAGRLLDADTRRLAMIVFLTDGRPTIGSTHIPDILKAAKTANTRDARLFVFGVGNDVNTDLLDLLASENRGTQTYVSEREDIEVKVSSFYDKIAMPVLTDVSIEVAGIKLQDMYPRRVPDIFRGGQVLLFGRYRGDGPRDVVLRGTADGKAQVFECSVDFNGSERHAFVPAIWAHRKVAFLLEEIRTRGHNKELEDEIVTLGRRYGIVTPYTSFLIVEDRLPEAEQRMLREARRRFEADKSGMEAVDMSSSVAESKAIDRELPSEPRAMGFAPARGESAGPAADGAVSGDAWHASSLQTAALHRIRKVADKVFYLQTDGVYYDSVFDETNRAAIVDVVVFSDAYFELLTRHPGIGRYLAGDFDRVLCIDGAVYRIKP